MTFARGIYPGLLAQISKQGPWRIQTTEDSTYEIPPVVIDESWRGDGLIVFRCTSSEARAWKRRGIHVVNLSSEPPAGDQSELAIPSVAPNNQAMGRLAAEHFLVRGLQHFACWSDPTRNYSTQRLSGFSETLAQAGYGVEVLEMAVSPLPFRSRWRAIEANLRTRLVELTTPVGLFAKDDISAACIIRVCQMIGLKVPEDIAIIGCNNDSAFVYTTTPSLTSVVYPASAIGVAAASLLDQMLNNKVGHPIESYRVPVHEIIERESTAIFGFNDPLVRRAMKRIHELPDEIAPRVDQLAWDLAVGSSTLRRRFLQSTGNSLKSAVDALRIARIQRRLKQRDQSIKQIAFACGFQSSEDLSRFVRRHTNQSPTEWRAQHCSDVSNL